MITVGLLFLVASLAALDGQTWGRMVGIPLAVLSALANSPTLNRITATDAYYESALSGE